MENIDVVLVGGFGNDYPFFWPAFEDINKVLQNEYRLSEQHIHQILPSSVRENESGINEVKDVLNSIRKADPKRKIILIGYSRGGVIAMETLMEDSSLLDSIHAIVTVSSPLKGTAVAKIGTKLLNAVSKMIMKLGKVGNNMQICNCEYYSNADLSRGMRTMVPSETISNKLMKLSDNDYSKLSKVLYFVTTSTTSLREPTKVGTYVLAQESDGTVPKANQSLDSIGHRMAELDAGHTDLMMSGFKSSLSENDRKAFARTLIDSLIGRQR